MRAFRTPAAFTLAAILVASPVAAQMDPGVPVGPTVAVPIPDARTAWIATTVAKAEAEGKKWPSVSVPSTQPESGGTRSLLGEAPRTCVGAYSIGPIRSGDFLVGGEIGGADAVNGSVRAAKVWWMPKYPVRNDSLIVRAALLGSPSDTMRLVMTSWASSGPSKGPWFYPSATRLPKSGRWLVVATSGPNWGCFVLESL